MSAGAVGELLLILDAKVTSSGDRDLLTAVKSFNGTPDQLRLNSTIRELAGDRLLDLVCRCWGSWKAC